MNILMAADVSPLDEGSGAERVLHHHARAFAARGHRVDIVFRAAEPAAVPSEWEGCRLWPYRVDRSGPVSFLVSSVRRGGVALRRAFAELRPDVINVHQPHSGLMTLLRSPSPRPPIVYTFLSPAPAEYVRRASERGVWRGQEDGPSLWRESGARQGSEDGARQGGEDGTGRRREDGTGQGRDDGAVQAPRDDTRRPWPRLRRRRLIAQGLRLVEGFVLRRAAAITVLSDFMRQELLRWHPRCRDAEIRRVPGGVDVRKFTPAVDRRELRRRLGYPASSRLLLTVRNLEPRTGVEALLGAVGRLSRRRRDVLLLVAGCGPLRPRIERLVDELGIADLVRLLGFVDEARLVDLYCAADLYVQPDVDLQGFGLPIIEAMACGTPVLATPVGGAVDILEPFDRRCLLAGASAEEIARGIDRALDDRQLLTSGPRARRYVERAFSWEVVTSSAEALFASVAAAVDRDAGTGAGAAESRPS